MCPKVIQILYVIEKTFVAYAFNVLPIALKHEEL